MITKREKLQYIYVFLTDLLVLLLSTLLAWLVTDGLLNQLVPYAPSDWVQTICLLMLAFMATFICFDQTENIVTRTSGEEIKLSIKFNVLLALVYSTAMLLTKATMLDSRYFTLAVPLINFVLLPIAHGLLKRSLLQIQSQSGLESLVGLITTQDRAELLINELQRDWSKRISGVAILEAPASEIGSMLAGVPVTANYDNFMDWIRQAALDEIYVDIPMDSGESFIPVLEEMESMGLTVHFRLLLLDRIEERCCGETSAVRFSRILGRCAGGNIVTMGTLELKLRDRVLKRAMDIVGGLVGCIISVPIIAITAIPLKLESPGPLIFKQKRVGLNGRVFYIHKLRSMYMDAEERKKSLMTQNEMNGLIQSCHLLVQQFNLFFHRHVQNFSSWIYHSGLLLYCLVQCIPDGWIFIKESSRQSSFLHQLWNADTFFICQHILYCLQCQFNFLFTFSLIFLNHLVVFAHILHPILPDSYI